MAVNNRSVIDGDRKYVLYWPQRNATHTTIMKSLPVAKGVRSSARNYWLRAHPNGTLEKSYYARHVGWIYELQPYSNGIRLELVDDDSNYVGEYLADS